MVQLTIAAADTYSAGTINSSLVQSVQTTGAGSLATCLEVSQLHLAVVHATICQQLLMMSYIVTAWRPLLLACPPMALKSSCTITVMKHAVQVANLNLHAGRYLNLHAGQYLNLHAAQK